MLKNITFVVAILITSTQILLAQETVKCKGVEMKISENSTKDANECAASLGITDKASITPAKKACMIMCVVEKHLLNMLKFAESVVPDSRKAELTTLVAECVKIRSEEESCSPYAKFTICLSAVFTHYCK